MTTGGHPPPNCLNVRLRRSLVLTVPFAAIRPRGFMTDLKEIIAKLLEDARHLNEIAPNAGTAARIKEAEEALKAAS